MITIIDYGLGNLESIANMLKKLGQTSLISSRKEDILNATKLILPGVGSFDTGMNNLKERGFIEILNKRVIEDKTPILGICLGMQLLTNSSEEGIEEGLGWIEGQSLKFVYDHLKVPHMGWNSIEIHKESPLFESTKKHRKYYFVHSYHVHCKHERDILATSEYGIDFNSMVKKNNIYGAQFHPEKSHKYGMEILNQYAKIV
tara:strand:- start:3929 stop:4534 length:606 start_codon:yes stop_codon:yes gene_type:complete